MKKYEILRVLNDSSFENSDLWVAEAEFGLSYLKEKIDSFEGAAKILEVGCGTGILLLQKVLVLKSLAFFHRRNFRKNNFLHNTNFHGLLPLYPHG